MDRRQFMRVAGATSGLTATALAGCSDILSDVESSVTGSEESGSVSDGETAPYNKWVGQGMTQSDSKMYAASVAGETLRSDDGEGSQENERIQSDALATVLIQWGVSIGFVSMGAESVGLTSPNAEGAGTDHFHLINGTRVVEGDFEPARIEAANEDAERVEEYHGYTLYLDGALTVAASDEAVLWATDDSPLVTDSTARVKAHIDAASGESRLAAEYSAFDDLQSALPSRGYAGTVFNADGDVLEGESNTDYTQMEDTDLDSDVLGYAGSSAVDGNDLTASVAVRYADADAVDDRETIESALGEEADERTIEIDGPMVIVEGEYTDL